MKWKIEGGLKYTRKHEWLRMEEDDKVTVGICDYAQDKLDSIVFVELPQPGKVVNGGESIAVLESVKAVVDTYAPVSGTVVKVNDDLADRPELINEDPYGQGWIVEMKMEDKEELTSLMDEREYELFMEQEEGEE